MANKYVIEREKPYPLGCYIDYDKSLVVRAVFEDNKSCGIKLYPDSKDRNKEILTIELPKANKRGSIYSARFSGIENIDSYTSYNYYEDDSYFCDPYAKHILGLESFGKYVAASDIRARLENKSLSGTVDKGFDWGKEKSPMIPYEESFIYLMHVRGFTKASSSNLPSSKRGTFNGIIEKIPYLKSIGVTSIELMPVIEMNEMDTDDNSAKLEGKTNILYSRNGSITDTNTMPSKLNFWGYKRGYYFAPRTAYCENTDDPVTEFKSFVKTMHDNGLEVILQFYFSENESESLIIDVLRFWRCTYHVDGFHLKGARIPIRLIAKEPLFTDVKIFYEWFDYGDIYKGQKPPVRLLGEYNNSFLYTARRFLKSDDNTVNDFLRCMIANGTDHGIVNYVADYEGFRLADLVSYEHKHNEENGENNKDGSDNNLSWNCGIEGRTRKQSILELRKKQIKNIMTMLFLSQGTPMLFGGDEFCNSQQGNNNPYCQDNEISYVDWKALDKNQDIFEYFRFLTELRFKYKLFHKKHPYKLMDYLSCGYPDLSCHGREAWRPDLSGHSHLLGMLYCGNYDSKVKDAPFIYVCYNMHWTKQEIALPKLPEGYEFKLLSDTGMEKADSGFKEDEQKNLYVTMEERSVRIYLGEKDPNYKPKKKTRGTKK